jgi:putative phosphoribosyl transferase
MLQLPFEDRFEAGRFLGAELASRQIQGNVIVLALPRGGVQVAAPVAGALNAPLDVLVVRKLGVPWQPELAMGAIAGGARVLDQNLIRQLGISREELDAIAARETQEMERRERLYRDGRPALNLAGRIVVLVDDGVATGSTLGAAARHIRGSTPRKLIIAAPVASADAARRLQHEADETVWLANPEPFYAVGEWYTDFGQVTDDEVRSLLQERAQALQRRV